MKVNSALWRCLAFVGRKGTINVSIEKQGEPNSRWIFITGNLTVFRANL